MSTIARPDGLDDHARALLTSNPNAAAELPQGEFELMDLEYRSARRLVERLCGTEAIDVIDADPLRYQLTEKGRDRRSATLDSGWRPLPCGHTGLRNVDGVHYVCGWCECNDVYRREEIADA